VNRYLIYILSVAAFWVCQAFAQNVPENAILDLEGGKFKLTGAFYSPLLSGGVGIGYKSSDAWDLWANPAAPVTFHEPYISLAYGPAVLSDPQRFYDVNATVQQEVDTAIEEFRTAESRIDYPQFASQVGQQSELAGLFIAFPSAMKGRKSVLSFSFDSPFVFRFGLGNNGFGTLLETRKKVGEQNKVIRMRLKSMMNADISFSAFRYKAGLATFLNDRTALGFQMNYTHLHFFSKASAKINGIMTTAGAEYAFNDPFDPRIDFAAGETNSLDQSLWADFSGSQVSCDLGALFKLDEMWTGGIDLYLASTATLRGEMDIVQHKIPALNMSAFSDGANADDLFDPTKLDLAKLTLTEPVPNKTFDTATFSLPSSIGVQISRQGNMVEATLSAKKYLGHFGFGFLDDELYLAPNFDMNLDFSFGIVKISVGGLRTDFVIRNADDRDVTPLWIPHGSVETAFFIMKNYQVSGRLFVEPAPGLSLKFGYFF
jgi:hypothetical protein